ncbi:MFS transporter, partial [Lactobacillus selangorensis]
MLATIIATTLIDKAGRKPLMMTGSVLMTLFSLAIALMFGGNSGLILLFCVFGFVISFAFSMGPIPWI